MTALLERPHCSTPAPVAVVPCPGCGCTLAICIAMQCTHRCCCPHNPPTSVAALVLRLLTWAARAVAGSRP